MKTIGRMAKPCGIAGGVWAVLLPILLTLIIPARTFATSVVESWSWGILVIITFMALMGLLGLLSIILNKGNPRLSRIFIWVSALVMLVISLVSTISMVSVGIILLPAAILLILAAIGMRKQMKPSSALKGVQAVKDKAKLCIGLLALGLFLLVHSSCTPGLSPAAPGKIAFISDREGEPFIYVMNPDGSNPTKIGSWCGYDNTFCWSPNGERIAFIDRDGWLCLVDADGSNLSKLIELPSLSIVWSPDSGKIVAGCLDNDIYSVDFEAVTLENLTNTPNVVENLPVWSPDSKKIAFIVFNSPHCNITLMDADGSNQTILASERGICEELVWSPAGEKLSYAWYSEDNQDPEGICRDICLVDIGDGSKVNLTGSPKYDDRDVSWSPDGTKIVFSSRRQVVDMQLYVMNADGSQSDKLTTGESSNYLPAWSPDGKHIIFTSSGPHPTGKDIWVMGANGSNVVNLTNTPDIDDYMPVWSP
jgi:Tol biopolymer transport system component